MKDDDQRLKDVKMEDVACHVIPVSVPEAAADWWYLNSIFCHMVALFKKYRVAPKAPEELTLADKKERLCAVYTVLKAVEASLMSVPGSCTMSVSNKIDYIDRDIQCFADVTRKYLSGQGWESSEVIEVEIHVREYVVGDFHINLNDVSVEWMELAIVSDLGDVQVCSSDGTSVLSFMDPTLGHNSYRWSVRKWSCNVEVGTAV
jgi:hypothetical protein